MSNIFDFVKDRTRRPYLEPGDVTEALKTHTTAAVRRDVLAVLAGRDDIQYGPTWNDMQAVADAAWIGNDKKKRSADATD